MKPIWDSLSLPQQVVIKAFYGLPLTTPEELTIWAIFNDDVVYDELGYPISTGSVEYEPKEYSILAGIIGRRAGKSAAIGAFIALYEIIFGGHMEHVEEGQDVFVPYIAQDLATAKANMKAISIMAKKSAKIFAEIVTDTREKIEFKNGIIVLPEPPAIKTGRGVAFPIIIMDEVGFWYKTSEAANPDYEVQRAVSFAQLQFPRAKQIIISTPYVEEGLIWDYFKAGTAGNKLPIEDRREYSDTLVIQSSTAAMQNPRIKRRNLERLQIEDPEAFVRESLARFVSAISGFLSQELVANATLTGVKYKSKKEFDDLPVTPIFVGAMDPAFRHDSFAFAIFHMDSDGTVHQDLLKTWTPDKKLKVKLDPGVILAEIAAICKEWKLTHVVSDQYQQESLQYIAQLNGFTIVGYDFTGKSKAKMYGSLLQLMRTNKIKILDIPIIYQQLTQLQKKLTAIGGINISAPPGKHDDVATVVALGATMALYSAPMVKPVKTEPSLFELGVATIRNRMDMANSERWE